LQLPQAEFRLYAQVIQYSFSFLVGNAKNESTFAFLRTILSQHPDPVSHLDLFTKALTLRLEQNSLAPETAGLVRDIASIIVDRDGIGQICSNPVK
jgi:hypothetical protein